MSMRCATVKGRGERWTRREFIKTAPVLLACAANLPLFLARSAVAASRQPQTDASILVVLQLSGGNDGLNTIVPFNDDAYHRNRPTLRLTSRQVLKLSDDLGFHPEMAGFQKLYKEGLLTILQGIGYPQSSRDHATAMRNWHSARPGELAPQLGWAGQAMESMSALTHQDVPGVFVGNIKAPFAIRTNRLVVPSIQQLEDWQIPSLFSKIDELERTGRQTDNSLLKFVRQTVAESTTASRRLEELTVRHGNRNSRSYPVFKLAQHLELVANLIRANLGLRLFFVELGGGGIGGFDTHAGQALNHGALLRELSASVTAFIEDLRQDKLADRVLLMTFSEFGRTLKESGRRGTDHGLAAPMFLAGGTLKGGLVGAHPNLANLDGDSPKHHTDFRRILATVLERWLRLPSQPVLGEAFATMDIL